MFFLSANAGYADAFLERIKEVYTIEPFETRIGGSLSTKDIRETLMKYDGEDRGECEEYIIAAFEKTCDKIAILPKDDYPRKSRWINSFKALCYNGFSPMKITRTSSGANLRIAKAIGKIPYRKLDMYDRREVSYDYLEYIKALNDLREQMIFLCCIKMYHLRIAIGEDKGNATIKEFADAAKMTKEEREAFSKNGPGKMNW